MPSGHVMFTSNIDTVHMMEVMSALPDYSNSAGAGQYAGVTDRPLTKFEKRGQRLGHVVNDLVFIRER